MKVYLVGIKCVYPVSGDLRAQVQRQEDHYDDDVKFLKLSLSVCVCVEMLEVRYKLDSSREAEVLRSRVRSLADGQLHSISVSRVLDSVSVQVKTSM